MHLKRIFTYLDIVGGLAIIAGPRIAHAVPAFAQQTGQPCSSCHIGAFGPELTPFGRSFKIGGYTMGGGTGLASRIPVSAMVLGSFTNTARDQSAPASEHYGSNNNVALDQISVFLAGRVNDHVGGFIQGTFDGVASQLFLDNTDIRVVNDGKVLGQSVNYGLSFNDSPGLSDPYNSTYPWGYPYVAAPLAVSPLAGTLLDGGLAGNSIGVNAYALVNDHVYVDLGLYDTMAPDVLKPLGEVYSYGSATAPAPYARIAYEWDWGNNNAHLGGTVFHSRFNPAIADRSANGAFGHDSYTDVMADGGYQFIKGANTLTLNGRYTYESSRLHGTTAQGGSDRVNNSLSDVRATAVYYFQNTYGATVSWSSLWAPRNSLLYAGGTPDFGSANGKPDTDALTVEADWVPFGKSGSAFAPFANLKLGIQYTLYTKFNGASHNYDGFGRNAADNDTLYLFAWTAF